MECAHGLVILKEHVDRFDSKEGCSIVIRYCLLNHTRVRLHQLFRNTVLCEFCLTQV